VDEIENTAAGERVQNALPFPAIVHQTDIPQYRQMFRDGGNIGSNFFGQIPNTSLTLGKPQYDIETRGVRERFQYIHPMFMKVFVLCIHPIW
jgi:hypothetical protein